MLKEFKEFAVKGNVMDMAIGVIIGGAFGKIVSSFVTDVVMPPIGLMMGGIDFNSLSWILEPATETTEAVTINYGMFINNIIDFLIIAFVVFMAVRYINKLKKQKEEGPAEIQKSDNVILLEEIRDLLKDK